MTVGTADSRAARRDSLSLCEHRAEKIQGDCLAGLDSDRRCHEEATFGDVEDPPRRLLGIPQERIFAEPLKPLQDRQIELTRSFVNSVAWIRERHERTDSQTGSNLPVAHSVAEDERGGFELRPWIRVLQRRLYADLIFQESLNFVQDRANQAVFGFEVVIDRHLRNPAVADDSIHAGREAFLEEDARGALKDLVFFCFGNHDVRRVCRPEAKLPWAEECSDWCDQPTTEAVASLLSRGRVPISRLARAYGSWPLGEGADGCVMLDVKPSRLGSLASVAIGAHCVLAL